VRDTDTGQTYTALQAAVDAASQGDRLTVRGVCRGTTVLDKGVVIEGVRTTTRPLLAGGHEGVVLTVRRGVTATVKDLAIEGGRGRFREGGPEKPYNWPAGVLNQGSLTLHSVIVKGNRGIGIENTGRLRLNGDSIVRDNGFDSVNKHEGIHNTGTLRLNGTASVRWPDWVKNESILVMNGASRIWNLWNWGTAILRDRSSGGPMTNRGTLTLNDTAQVVGSAVYNDGTLTLNDASGIVRGDIGVFNASGATVVMNGRSFISDHESTAVVNSGTFTLNDDSRVSHNGDFRYEVAPAVINTGRLTLNSASHISGNWMGVENENSGSITLNGSSAIRDNHRMQYRSRCPRSCPPWPRLVGAGVSNKGSLTLNDQSSITGNSAADSGAGVYLWEGTGASLTMTGSSTISGNTTGQTGGGIYVGAGSVLDGVMCGSQSYANVVGNTPDDCYIE
jgi:hypothetical protein